MEVRAEVQEKREEDKEFAEMVDEKVEEWRQKMKTRDDIIVEQNRELEDLKIKVRELRGRSGIRNDENSQVLFIRLS